MPAYSRILLPWDSQPQEAVEVAKPYADKLALLYSAPFDELLGGEGVTPVTVVGKVATVGGMAAATQLARQYPYGNLRPTTAVSVMAVVNLTASSGSNERIFQAQEAGASPYQGYGLYRNSSGVVRFGAGNSASIITEVSEPSAVLGLHTYVGTFDSATVRLYRDGVLVASASRATGISYTANAVPAIGLYFTGAQVPQTNQYLRGNVLMVGAWSERALPVGESVTLSANPWQVFTPRSIWVPVSAGGGGVSGTLATTNANDTSSASGTTTVTGTVARTNANDTSAASGTTTIVGTLATTNANDTSAASGSVGGDVTGTVAYTNANDTVSASGTTTVAGTVARTNENDSAAASGWAGAVTGTLAYTNANDTADASGIAETGFLAGIGGWGQIRRRKRKDEDEDKPQELPEVVEIVAKPRKTLKLADIIGKRQAAQITSVDLSEAVAASKKRKRQQEDELLLLM